MITIGTRIRIPLSEFEFSYARSGGPGGQNVNKVSSKAILRWAVLNSTVLPVDVRKRFLEKYGGRLTEAGELIITSQKYRDQKRNTEDCLAKLEQMLTEVATPPTLRFATKPTLGAKIRRIESKQAQGNKKRGRQRPSFDD
ncbi:MAG: alternative ribosome rescue aminoacyl-tRNA hydrolase ArfB [Candidatus Obscuribacter sp.]|nr:alternative ribosome rescue aminoacyl-tRNA hydrolase ArfB [Candidatus Obscuribacter sp.]